MPQCFENWCRRFDDVFSRQKQRQEFRVYLGGLLGESQRKNLSQLVTNTLLWLLQQPEALPRAMHLGMKRG